MGVAVAISAAMGGAAHVPGPDTVPGLGPVTDWKQLCIHTLGQPSPAQPSQPNPGTSATVSFKNFSRGFHVIHVNMSDSYRAVITFFLCFNFTVYFIQMVHN